MTDAPVVVLGAGFAGLVAAVELRDLGHDVVVLEASDTIGGLARTHRADGLTFDTGAHFVTNRLATAIGVMDRCDDAVSYGEAVWHDGHSAAYPFGLLRTPRFAWDAVRSRLRSASAPPADAADAFRSAYGRALADEIALPLLEAWSGLPATELSTEVLEKIPGGIGETIALTLSRRLTHRAVAIGYCAEAPQSPNVWHVYPRDGLDVFVHHLAAQLEGSIRTASPVHGIDIEDDAVRSVTTGTDRIRASAVVSTLPAPVLAHLSEHEALRPLADLRFRAMAFLQLRLPGRGLLPQPVTWFPDAAQRFFRVTEVPMAMPWLAPAGETVLTVDFGATTGDAVWEAPTDELVELARDGLRPLLGEVRVVDAHVTRTPLAYPVLARRTEPARRAITGHGIRGLVSVGRNAEFRHLLMEDVYWRTLRAVRALDHGVLTG
ncbi:MAG: protoporphyrinogen/coproporphyrinogen oxidase [Acidimicrobiia bacterium]